MLSDFENAYFKGEYLRTALILTNAVWDNIFIDEVECRGQGDPLSLKASQTYPGMESTTTVRLRHSHDRRRSQQG